ncbi:hypothetical protein [Bacillus velezensis]|uniref:hypothetical protein n=1 Tax=Bacillus velezensis TaxID=492670 RepID=UPI001CB9D478|nr:hypothetical protein [Bacillus velezensis]
MTRYKKRPIEVEAFEYGTDWPDWFHDKVKSSDVVTYAGIIPSSDPFERSEGLWCEIKTLEGIMTAKEGDWIIKGINGEIYPCKPDIFKKTYEKVDSEMKTADPSEEIRINGLLTMLGITANHDLTEFEEVYAELKATLFKGDESHMKKVSPKGEPAIFPKTYTQGK